MNTSVAHDFLDGALRFPERALLRTCRDGAWQSLTYGNAAPRIAATLTWLVEHGLGRGDRLVCHVDEDATAELLMLSLACASLGVVICPLGTNFSAAALDHFARCVEAAAIFTSDELAPGLQSLGRRILTGGPRGLAVAPDCAAALRTLEAALAKVEAADAYGIFQVSTPTGESTYVIRSHLSFAGQVPHFAEGLDTAGAQPRCLLLNSLNHSAGHTGISLAVGISAEMGLPSRIDRHAPVAEVRAFAPHIVITSDRVFAMLLAQAGHEPAFGPGPTKAVVVGPAIDPQLIRALIESGVDAGECYGTQETGLLVTTPPRGWRAGFKGRVLPDVEMKLAEDGEVLVRSPRAMSGYVGPRAEEQSRAVFTPDRFYRSGDYGEIVDGYLRILGRKKDVLRIHDGSLVYPSRIEEMICGSPWIDRVTLLGDQRPHLIAFIELSTANLRPESDGYLDPERHPERYQTARRFLGHVNRRLEAIEQVRQVILFASPSRSAGEAREGRSARDRSTLWAAHRERFEALYTRPPSEDDLSWILEERELD